MANALQPRLILPVGPKWSHVRSTAPGFMRTDTLSAKELSLGFGLQFLQGLALGLTLGHNACKFVYYACKYTHIHKFTHTQSVLSYTLSQKDEIHKGKTDACPLV